MFSTQSLADLHASQLKAGKLHVGTIQVPGLPATGATPSGALRGATSTLLGVPVALRPIADVTHQPSLKVIRTDTNGAESVLFRRTKYIGELKDDDLSEIRKVMAKVVERARALSQGPLNSLVLRQMGHPYGRNSQGLMRGKLGGKIGKVKTISGSVPSLSVLNIQTGKLANSWSGKVELTEKGAKLSLINPTEHAAYLALGTIRMQAHGPWTAAMNSFVVEIDRAWRKAIRKAVQRTDLEKSIGLAYGLNK